MVKFTVEKDGSVSDIRLEHTKLKKTVGPGSELDYMDASTFNLQNKTILAKLAEAAAEAVKTTSGQWQPATRNGAPVAAEMYLPVQFSGSAVEGLGETRNSSHTRQESPTQAANAKELNPESVVPPFKLDQRPAFKGGEMPPRSSLPKTSATPTHRWKETLPLPLLFMKTAAPENRRLAQAWARC